MENRALNNIRLQYTRWEDLTFEDQLCYADWMGGNPAEGATFYHYTNYWYNIPCQIGHLLRAIYQDKQPDAWGEESAACQFASAYWKAKGETRRLYAYERMLLTAAATMPAPVSAGIEQEINFGERSAVLEKTPEARAYYHFHMALASLRRPLDFPLALRTLITPAASDGSTIPLSPEFALDELLPYHTLEDLEKTLTAYGVHLPPIQISCSYTPAIIRLDWEE